MNHEEMIKKAIQDAKLSAPLSVADGIALAEMIDDLAAELIEQVIDPKRQDAIIAVIDRTQVFRDKFID